MNVIVVMIDSLRQDHVSFYGWPDCPLETPNMDAFAAEAVVFDNCYPEGMPTIPVRTDLMTGQSSLTNRTWQPLSSTDVTAAQLFRKEGYLCALEADTYHIFKPGMNFHTGFDIFHWIRGAEYDGCRVGPPKLLKLEDHINERIPEDWHPQVRAAIRNLEGRVEPEDFPCRQTMDSARTVLEDARRVEKPLFLWIDTFQTHEPWCPPARFDTFADPGYNGPKIVMPPGIPVEEWASQKEIQRIRSLYAGETAYVDDCIGKLFDAMRGMGYFDNSVVVILSDHGHPLGDHGKFLKGTGRMYSELLKVPFMVRLPGGENGGRRVDDLARFPDLLPTLLDLTGLGNNTNSMAGTSLRPVIEATGGTPYKATITGFFPGLPRTVRNKRYSYMMKEPGEGDELYDLEADPYERNNILNDNLDVAQALVNEIGGAYFAPETKPRGLQGSFEVADTPLA